MALLNKKFANFFGLVDEEYEEEVQEEQKNAPAPPVFRNKSDANLQQAVNEPNRETRFSEGIQRALKESKERQSSRPQPQFQESSKVVSMTSGPNRSSGSKKTVSSSSSHGAGKITIIEPRVYSEAMTIAKRILAGESVLVNFYLLDENQARRVVDFLTGAVYAEDGDIKRVGDEVFLCTPSGVEIDSVVEQSLAEAGFFE